MGDALTLAFIEARPAAAARTLAKMAPEQAAALLEDIPARYVQRIASHTSAWIGASILGHMSPVAAAAALRGLSNDEAAAILRLMPPHVRAPLLQEIPAALRKALETSLSFAADAVGAHMTLTVIVLGKGETAGDARAHARRNPDAMAEAVFVVDEDRRLAGFVGAAALLQSADETPIAKLMQTDVAPLSPRTTLAAAASLEAWQEHAVLPVTNRQRQVLGALLRKTALGAPEHLAGGQGRAPPVAAQLAEAFAASTLELAELMTENDGPDTRKEDAP